MRRQGEKLQRGLGDDPQQPLRTDEQPVQVETGFVFVGAAAQADERSIGQRDFQPKHVIAGDAVLQTTRPAGVGGDVAAEAAVGAARRVGRIKPPAPLHRLLQRLGEDTRLDHRDKVLGIDFPDAVHPRQAEHNAAAHRHAAPDVTVACAASCHRNSVFVGEAQKRGDGACPTGQGDGLGAMRGQPMIAGELLAEGRLQAQLAGREQFFEARQRLEAAHAGDSSLASILSIKPRQPLSGRRK